MKDFVERVAATFVQALLAAVTVSGFDIGDADAWKVAVGAAALAVVKWLAVHYLKGDDVV